MSEFYRPPSQEEKDTFKQALSSAPNEATIDQLIEDKAHQILDELREETSLEQNIDSEIQPAVPENLEINEKVLAEYNTKDLVELINSLIHSNSNEEHIGQLTEISTFLNVLVQQEEEKILALQTLVQTYKGQNTSARVQVEIIKLSQKIENFKIIQDTYESLIELTQYRPGEILDLQETSMDVLISRYRTYETYINDFDFPESHPAINMLEEIKSQYYTEILQSIERNQIHQEYGLGTAEGRPLSIGTLKHLLTPDKEDPNFNPYLKRLLAQRSKTTQSLPEGQDQVSKDDARGKESEDFVTTELVKTPGVLATIDIPKFSIGDTRFKADTIAITLNPEIRDSITHQDIQLAIYQLIQEFELVLNNYIQEYGQESLVDPRDKLIGELIKISRDIKLDDIDKNSIRTIILGDILQMHRIQIKTQSTAMTTALAEYKRSRNAVSPEGVGFLAKEYHKAGNKDPETFDPTHLQIAAQTILGLPIQ